MWYRSWPTDGDWARRSNRAHVVDRLPRLHVSNFDYLTVEKWPSERTGFCMLEWDVALDQRARTRFARIAKEHPARVLVAPYWYGAQGFLPNDKTEADAFGFGCIYFPAPVLLEAIEHFRAAGTRLCDMTFSHWHLRRFGPARVTWGVHPQHLHDF